MNAEFMGEQVHFMAQTDEEMFLSILRGLGTSVILETCKASMGLQRLHSIRMHGHWKY
jgi:hypothetical protein